MAANEHALASIELDSQAVATFTVRRTRNVMTRRGPGVHRASTPHTSLSPSRMAYTMTLPHEVVSVVVTPAAQLRVMLGRGPDDAGGHYGATLVLAAHIAQLRAVRL